jgi:hypothetical protein
MLNIASTYQIRQQAKNNSANGSVNKFPNYFITHNFCTQGIPKLSSIAGNSMAQPIKATI